MGAEGVGLGAAPKQLQELPRFAMDIGATGSWSDR